VKQKDWGNFHTEEETGNFPEPDTPPGEA